MTTPITLTLLQDERVDSDAVEHALPGAPFSVAARATGLEDARRIAGGTTKAALVACDGVPGAGEALVAAALAARPGRPVVVLCTDTGDGTLERLLEAGADDVLMLPEQREDVAFALRKAIARRNGASDAPGRVVAVIGPKGGTGKTVVSTNIAVALARTGHRPILVDADLQCGDVASALGLQPKATIGDLARTGGTLDAEKVAGYLLEHHSGLRVLAAPLRPDEAATVGTELLSQVLAHLRELGDVVIVDSGPGFPPEVIATIDSADAVCLVATLDVASLKDSKLGLETLSLMGRDPASCLIVLNRADGHVGISTRDVEEVLGRSPDAQLPTDREVPRSLNQGEPMVLARPRATVSRALAALAAEVDGGAAAHGEPRRALRLLTGRA